MENFLKTFFLENTCGCVLGPWPCTITSIPVLGLERFCPRKGCPWKMALGKLWIFFVSLALALDLRALCPRLHLWYLHFPHTFRAKRIQPCYSHTSSFSFFSPKKIKLATEWCQNTTNISIPVSLLQPISALLPILQERSQLSHLYRYLIVVFLQCSTLSKSHLIFCTELLTFLQSKKCCFLFHAKDGWRLQQYQLAQCVSLHYAK